MTWGNNQLCSWAAVDKKQGRVNFAFTPGVGMGYICSIGSLHVVCMSLVSCLCGFATSVYYFYVHVTKVAKRTFDLSRKELDYVREACSGE